MWISLDPTWMMFLPPVLVPKRLLPSRMGPLSFLENLSPPALMSWIHIQRKR